MKRSKEPKTEIVKLRASKDWLNSVQIMASHKGTSVSQVIRESVEKQTKQGKRE